MLSKIEYLIVKMVGKLRCRIIPIHKATTTVETLPKDMQGEFKEIYEQCMDYTMTSIERMYALYQSVKYIVNSKVAGDFVECGIWKGGSSMLIAYTLLKLGDLCRKIYLYDTFEGMPKPIVKDKLLSDGTPAINIWRKYQSGNTSKYCFATLEEVKNNMSLTKYPQDNMIFVKGKIEDTIPKIMPSKISLLRLDTDWFESTYHELNYLFPLLSSGGVLIIDDYGHWSGAKEAMDKYFLENNIHILLNRIDYTGRLGIKHIA